MGFTPTLPSSLSDLIKPAMFADLTGPEAGKIWEDYHSDKPSSCGVSFASPSSISTERVLSNASRSPFFIHPLFSPSDGSFSVLLVQFFPDSGIFVLTDLDQYKANPETAQPVMMFACYADFEVDKNVVLVRGDVVGAAVGKDEAKFAIETILDKFNGADENEEGMGPYKFNHASNEFDVDKYVEETRVCKKAGRDSG